jgi:iron complex transport system ATP-binding protein
VTAAILRYVAATVGYRAPVVSEVGLAVEAGELVGLIGPNGAGKTTLLRAVTGGALVLSGEIMLDGLPLGSLARKEVARLVGVLPQQTPAEFAFSARSFVEMGRHARLSGFAATLSRADAAAVDRALQLTGTEHLASERLDRLSGGDVQRLTLAQALAQEPRVLLLDEPTSHLDLNHRLEVLDAVRALADGGLAVLAVFHDLDMAARYSDRLAVVADGGVRVQGPPADVLTSETLSAVFGVRAVIGRDAVTGAVQVTPVVREGVRPRDGAPRVLVISGSGTGAALMRRLALAGYSVRCGVLAEGDTDAAVARALGVPFTAVPLGTVMSADDGEALYEVAAESDAVAVVATPFGRPNVGNLRGVVEQAGRTVLVGAFSSSLDFTGGEAGALWKRMVEGGARQCADERAAVAALEEVCDR